MYHRREHWVATDHLDDEYWQYLEHEACDPIALKNKLINMAIDTVLDAEIDTDQATKPAPELDYVTVAGTDLCMAWSWWLTAVAKAELAHPVHYPSPRHLGKPQYWEHTQEVDYTGESNAWYSDTGYAVFQPQWARFRLVDNRVDEWTERQPYIDTTSLPLGTQLVFSDGSWFEWEESDSAYGYRWAKHVPPRTIEPPPKGFNPFSPATSD